MQTTLTELPDSRARVEVEVPAEDVGRATSRAARALAREMRLPGFRKGKAPPSLVIQRVGFPVVLEEAIREVLPEWYERALLDSGITPIGDPSIEMVSTPDAEGEPLEFKFEVGVRPVAQLGEYKGLEVGRKETEVDEEIVDTEVDRLRQGFARLEPVERAAQEGDALLIDFEGSVDGQAFQGGKAEDYLLELGSGNLIPGFEEQLVGAEPDAERDVEVTFPEDYQAEHLAGQDAVFKVKGLSSMTKAAMEAAFANLRDAAEFETLEELRADIREKVELILLIGADQFQRLRDGDPLCDLDSLARLGLYARPPYPLTVGGKAFVVPMPLMEVSSTGIRDRIASGESVRGMVPDAVLDYIQTHHLYSPQERRTR